MKFKFFLERDLKLGMSYKMTRHLCEFLVNFSDEVVKVSSLRNEVQRPFSCFQSLVREDDFPVTRDRTVDFGVSLFEGVNLDFYPKINLGPPEVKLDIDSEDFRPKVIQDLVTRSE